jgi:hypothetical protein
MYCVFLGRAVATNKPGAGSVGATQLASDAVTAAKLNDDIISGQTALGEAPADTDEFLVSDAGTLKRVDYSYIKGLSNWSESSGNLLPSNASYGIYLGVNSATAANLLDDYEEGTWTGTVSSGVFSYTHNTGYYRKVGNLVYIQIYIVISGYTSGSRVSLEGLPFTSKNISSYDGHYPISCTRFNNVHESVLAVYPMINAGGTSLKCDTMNSAGNSITSNNVEFFGASTIARFAGCYITD